MIELQFEKRRFIFCVYLSVLYFAISISANAQAGDHVDEQAVEANLNISNLNENNDKYENKEKQRDEHRGFFSRFELGLGYGFLKGDGLMDPAPGIPRIENPSHHSPVFSLASDVGFGFADLGLHIGAYFEKMILRSQVPTQMRVNLFGIGGGLTYFFTEHDFYATAQMRLYGLIVFLPEVDCEIYWEDKYDNYQGYGLSLAIGNDWFGNNDRAGGIGVLVNLARLTRNNLTYNFVSIMLGFHFTKF